MSLLVKIIHRKNKRDIIFQNSRRGISVVIGYVLLVTFAVVMGGIIYQWMKTYVPKDSLECNDGVSIFLKEYSCNNLELNLTLKNNGRFNVAGYFIHATNDSEQELAVIDLSQDIIKGGNKVGNMIRFGFVDDNSMKPNDEKKSIFSLSSEIYSIEIIPVRFQVEDNKKRLVSCGTSKIKEKITCITS